MKDFIIFEFKLDETLEEWNSNPANMKLSKKNYHKNPGFQSLLSKNLNVNMMKHQNMVYTDYFCFFNVDSWEEVLSEFKNSEPFDIYKVEPVKKKPSAPEELEGGRSFSPMQKYQELQAYVKEMWNIEIVEHKKSFEDFYFDFSGKEMKVKDSFYIWFFSNDKIDAIENEYENRYGLPDDDVLTLIGLQIFKNLN